MLLPFYRNVYSNLEVHFTKFDVVVSWALGFKPWPNHHELGLLKTGKSMFGCPEGHIIISVQMNA